MKLPAILTKLFSSDTEKDNEREQKMINAQVSLRRSPEDRLLEGLDIHIHESSVESSDGENKDNDGSWSS